MNNGLRLFLLFIVGSTLAVTSALAAGPEELEMNAEPETEPTQMPGFWVEESTAQPQPVFEEDTASGPLWDTGASYIVVRSDSLPTRVFIDGHAVVQTDSQMTVQVLPGKHFVSYFPCDRVHLAFRKEVSSVFWCALGPEVPLSGEYDLISTYDESAVRSGTVWLKTKRGETAPARLSWHESKHAYTRTGNRTAFALFGITTAIALAMVLSEALVDN